VAFSALGDVAVLSATVRDQNGATMPDVPLAWSSSADSVVTVSDEGLVTAVGNGVATLTVSSGSLSTHVSATVVQVASSLVVAPDSVVLKDPGDTAPMTVSAVDARGAAIVGPSVTWSSSDESVATVDTTGLVTAVGTGTVVIMATVDGETATGTARVEPEVTLVAAGPTAFSGLVGSQLSLAVRVEDLAGSAHEGTTVSWSTTTGSGSIASGATITSDVTGHAGAVWELGTTAGPQQATATIESRGTVLEVTFDATATPDVAVSVTLAADSIILNGHKETAFLGPTYLDRYGNTTTPGAVFFESRDEAVATVQPSGLITAVDAGSAYVVLGMGGPTDSLLVTVSLRGAITITFDDGWLDTYTNAFPVLQEFGLRANSAVNPAQVGLPVYMAQSHLDELHAAGWSIVSHTMTHDSLTTTTAGELDWELRASQIWIDEQGYNGSNVFVVPYHDWGARERDAIGQYYEAARGTSSTITSPDSLVAWKPSNPYDLTGVEAEFLPFTSVAGRDALRALLQRTVDEGAFVDIFFHHLYAADVDAFRELVMVIDEFRDRVLPYHELYPRFARSVF
jgi:uncharacterized protein YjdB